MVLCYLLTHKLNYMLSMLDSYIKSLKHFLLLHILFLKTPRGLYPSIYHTTSHPDENSRFLILAKTNKPHISYTRSI